MDNDWRTRPRKGKIKRDTNFCMRLPTTTREKWQRLADKEGCSLADWVLKNLENVQ